jgi:hypothetical protein
LLKGETLMLPTVFLLMAFVAYDPGYGTPAHWEPRISWGEKEKCEQYIANLPADAKANFACFAYTPEVPHERPCDVAQDHADLFNWNWETKGNAIMFGACYFQNTNDWGGRAGWCSSCKLWLPCISSEREARC